MRFSLLLPAALLLSACTVQCLPPEPMQHGAPPAPPPPHADARSNETIAALLPDRLYERTSFPRPYIVHMMRSCVDGLDQPRQKKSLVVEEGKTDAYCSCLVEKRVQKFKFSEYVEANTMSWDPKWVHEAVRKNSKIVAACYQRVLQ